MCARGFDRRAAVRPDHKLKTPGNADWWHSTRSAVRGLGHGPLGLDIDEQPIFRETFAALDLPRVDRRKVYLGMPLRAAATAR